MRSLILAAAMCAVTVPMAQPAMAQSSAQREYNRDIRQAERERQRDLRNADSRRDVNRANREYRQNVRQAQRDYRQYNRYDYNRLEPGQNRYYADRYYRDGRYYQERRLSARDRIYRGQNGSYYCRRPDGTTGLIVGAAVGGLLGNAIDGGRSSLLGTLVGAGAGGLLGREIERGNVRCR